MSTVDDKTPLPGGTTTPDAAGPPTMTSRQRLILFLLLGAQFTLAVDFSILNVAVPEIGAKVGFSLENLQWIATSFALTAAGFTLLFGRIADLFGRRKLFMAGIALLGAASLLGGLANSPTVLIIARVAQGLGTAMVTPAGLSLLTTSFPEGPLRDRALGLNGAMLSAGFTFGAVLGGVLTSLVSWRWAFLINVPVAVLILVVAPILLKESRTQHAKLDIPGAVTVSVGLISLVFGISQAGTKGWGSATTLGALALGVVLLVSFWFIELKSKEPLASVRVLGRRSVSFGNLGGAATFIGFTAMIFLLTLYLQEVLGYSPLTVGLCFGVLGIGAFLGGVTAPRWIGVFGSSRALLVISLIVQAVAVGILYFAGDNRGWLIPVLVLGFISSYGHVCAIVGYLVTATSGLPDDQQGLATGITTMTQQVSITIGIPIMSAIATSRIYSLGGATVENKLSGVTVAILSNGLIVLAVALIVGFFLRKGKTAAPVAG
ncbi:MFS transporter [Amycolatopsis sp. H20-H5]|uniref:MFS transporter n=1 Tax=Amycolatopsis sp. H20-H5 TaxID=3046309 RepID=UPI002DBBC0BE|nr:MFS transporter [Amycolatopsis sp. H20-H5]MEC3977531.1 MFS transporter [Amycolatopsis sp. H20-H5]